MTLEEVGTTGTDEEFVSSVKRRAQVKVREYYQLLTQQKRIEREVTNVRSYVEQLNDFLRREGESPVEIRDTSKASGFGKVGNRNPDYPIRRTEWEGLTIIEIVEMILDTSPQQPFHANVIAEKIYELNTKDDLSKVRHGLISTLRREAKNEHWKAIKGNMYQAIVTEEQGKLVGSNA